MQAYESGFDTLDAIHKGIEATIETETKLRRLQYRIQSASTTNEMSLCMNKAANAMATMNKMVTPQKMGAIIYKFGQEESYLESKEELIEDDHYDADTEERVQLLQEEHESRRADEVLLAMPSAPVPPSMHMNRDMSTTDS